MIMQERAKLEERLKTGTTTLGLICKDAVVLAAERKATMGYLIASKDEKKIVPIDKHIAVTTAGSVSDNQVLVRYLTAELRLHELGEDQKMPVTNAAIMASNILYSRGWYPYMVQLILAGWDSEGGHVFTIFPDGGYIEEKKWFSTGSGSPMVFGVLEHDWRENMDVEDAKKLAAQAVAAAIQRDAASGGSGIDVVVIDKKGIHEASDADVQRYIKK